MTNPAPYYSPFMELRKDWIDYNGHLNMAYYSALFDQGVDALWDQIGFGLEYRTTRGGTTFAAEFHVCYLREIHLGDKVRASWQLLEHNDRSWHFYQELIHEDGWVSATAEGLGLHIDTSGPRVAPMPPDILSTFETMQAEHDQLARPERVGRQMAIRGK